MAAWLHPQEMVEKLCRLIDVVHASDVRRKVRVMTIADRDKRLAEINAKMLELERIEEFCIEVGATYGYHPERRENANPLAILCMTMHKKERALMPMAAA